MITAEGYGLRGPRGRVFRDVSFSAPAGSLIAVEGPSGTGRTCLLLALTGRMKATEGRAEVCGHPLPKRMPAVRSISALGPVDGISALEPALTVAEHLRERVLLQRRFAARAARDRTDVAAALKAAGLDLDSLVKGERTAVRDLERLEALRLGVALALLPRPRVIGVDDVDHKLDEADREQAWAMLRSVADAGTTVIGVCTQAPGGALVVPARPAAPAARTAESAEPAESAAATTDPTAVATAAATTDATEEGAADAYTETRRA
ncbi:ATP-binding cassette domain-containing protein [Streptomyces sp. H10-C2]|uniref:ATP-binding cassette domain-containing protein n=1 Tax=Streptomyces sp. H10-C2 TaxID=3046210 RepID=UPI0024BB2300|nr:ATP-binding cassette domain-containing protein [Streptomyces sp. H10-C2]MDJ0369552.1 ATP-binding cassette domain-containing protein [Streptomyces sp. H10-C2]